MGVESTSESAVNRFIIIRIKVSLFDFLNATGIYIYICLKLACTAVPWPVIYLKMKPKLTEVIVQCLLLHSCGVLAICS